MQVRLFGDRFFDIGRATNSPTIAWPLKRWQEAGGLKQSYRTRPDPIKSKTMKTKESGRDHKFKKKKLSISSLDSPSITDDGYIFLMDLRENTIKMTRPHIETFSENHENGSCYLRSLIETRKSRRFTPPQNSDDLNGFLLLFPPQIAASFVFFLLRVPKQTGPTTIATILWFGRCRQCSRRCCGTAILRLASPILNDGASLLL